MQRARLGVVEDRPAELERQRRGVPELEQRPGDRDPEQDASREAGGLASAGIGFGDKLLEIREESGPESTYWMGSAKFSNEGTYLFRKLAAGVAASPFCQHRCCCGRQAVPAFGIVLIAGAKCKPVTDKREAPVFKDDQPKPVL